MARVRKWLVGIFSVTAGNRQQVAQSVVVAAPHCGKRDRRRCAFSPLRLRPGVIVGPVTVLVLALVAMLAGLWGWAVRKAARRSWSTLVGVTMALALLVYPFMAGMPAMVHVCDEYERRGFLDCGGIDGSREQVRLAAAIYGVLLVGHLVAAAWWFFRSRPSGAAHLR